jgi:FKBP-type peptidyl-prolyl cis-trans isomerase
MAVAVRDALAVQILLEGGADPDLRTRIDDCDTPLEMARAAGLSEIAALLEGRGAPLRQRLRSGLILLAEATGTGEPVHRQRNYRVRLRTWLADGTPVRWSTAWGRVDDARLEDDGGTLVTTIFVNRGQLMNGLFYGLDGMRVGGMRRLEIAPHLGFGDHGVPDLIPPRATLTVEVTVLAAVP